MAMTLEQIQAERTAFEAWARREGYAVEAMDMRDDGTYHGIGARNAWNAWQARSHLTQPAQAVDVSDEDVEAAGAAYFEQQWDMLPPRSKAIYRNALRRALKSFATRALSAEKAGWRVPDARPERRTDDERMRGFNEGWNACRAASLPASPTPDKEG